MSDMSERGSDFIRDLGESARKNPLSAALIGMGVLWLFAGSGPERAGKFARRTGLDRIPDKAGDAFEAARSTLTTGAHTFGEQVSSATGALREGGTETLDRAARFARKQAEAASEYEESIPSVGADVLDTVRANLTGLFRAQPLALGAIGLAIGAGIAAALPQTEVETEFLGKTSDTVKAKATQLGEEQIARAREVAEDVVEAVGEEARRQGLTVESAKSAVGGISEKIGRVVETAEKGVSERLKLKTL